MAQHQPSTQRVALAVAGLDPSGGAGVIADVKTFTAFGCLACAAVTSLTFQNTAGVSGASHQSAEIVRAQVLPVVADFRVAAWKTGMLPTREMVAEVARLARETSLRDAPLVVDPVMRSTSGFDLVGDDVLAVLKNDLLPLARVLTPNAPEAERITGLRVKDEEGMRRAARMMREMGARAVLVKGGHIEGDAVDVLDDAGEVTIFRAQRIASTSTHGTGCTLASAIAACLARGLSLAESVGAAKRYVAAAITRAPQIGHGVSPVDQNITVEFTERGILIGGE
jgi:hydroxymethylpyrimidine kinase/phosphomethylpyrimidine kinase